MVFSSGKQESLKSGSLGLAVSRLWKVEPLKRQRLEAPVQVDAALNYRTADPTDLAAAAAAQRKARGVRRREGVKMRLAPCSCTSRARRRNRHLDIHC